MQKFLSNWKDRFFNPTASDILPPRAVPTLFRALRTSPIVLLLQPLPVNFTPIAIQEERFARSLMPQV